MLSLGNSSFFMRGSDLTLTVNSYTSQVFSMFQFEIIEPSPTLIKIRCLPILNLLEERQFNRTSQSVYFHRSFHQESFGVLLFVLTVGTIFSLI